MFFNVLYSYVHPSPTHTMDTRGCVACRYARARSCSVAGFYFHAASIHVVPAHVCTAIGAYVCTLGLKRVCFSLYTIARECFSSEVRQ